MQFILSFKGFQFITALSLAVKGALKFYYCLNQGERSTSLPYSVIQCQGVTFRHYALARPPLLIIAEEVCRRLVAH